MARLAIALSLVALVPASADAGGPFGRKYGGIGHASHQNGLDADIYYPRRDGLETSPESPELIDRIRSQWLVDRAAWGAQFVFIGPHTGLRRPAKHVQYLAHHDNHLHLRIYPSGIQAVSGPSPAR